MAKTYGDPTNKKLREVVTRLMDDRFEGKRVRVAKAFGLTAGYISDFLNGHRGAGLELLVGLSKYAPHEVMSVLGISPTGVLVSSVQDGAQGDAEEDGEMQRLPAAVIRALRAAIELTGCAQEDAIKAAISAHEELGDVPGTDADWWLSKIRDRLPKRSISEVRPSTRVPAAKRIG